MERIEDITYGDSKMMEQFKDFLNDNQEHISPWLYGELTDLYDALDDKAYELEDKYEDVRENEKSLIDEVADLKHCIEELDWENTNLKSELEDLKDEAV